MKNNDNLFKDTSKLKSKIKVWRNVKYDADEFQMSWKVLEKKAKLKSQQRFKSERDIISTIKVNKVMKKYL